MDRSAYNQVDRLMLDAKKAILQEQHRRFQNLQREETFRLRDLVQCLTVVTRDLVASPGGDQQKQWDNDPARACHARTSP